VDRYWLHVNHPNSKAKLHVEDGCFWVREAVSKIARGQPYGPKLGNKNGFWLGPFTSLADAEKRQKDTDKDDQSRCQYCGF
jgi:hypothetical protein